MGLWKPVFLHVTKGISMNHPMVVTSNLAENYTSADLDILIEITNHLPKLVAGTLVIAMPTIFPQTLN